MTSNSNQFGLGLLIFAAGCGLGVLGMAVFGTSPNEAQRQREAPTIAPGSAEVVRQVVAEQERVTCDIDAPVSEIGVPAVDGETLIVSKIGVEEGQSIKSGDFLFEISGSPVVAFETPIPFYRDLKDGSAGDDVLALETNLVELGLLGAADTNFGSETSAALEKIFGPLGIESTDFSLVNVQSVLPESVVSVVNQSAGATLEPEDVILVLTRASSVANCTVPPSLSVDSGDEVSLEVGGNTIEGAIESVGQADETGFESAVFVPAEPFGEINTSGEVFLVIETATSDEGVLSVPVGALFESPSGGFELRIDGSDVAERVPVELGLVAGGFVEVISADVEEGDSVQLHSGPPPIDSSSTTADS